MISKFFSHKDKIFIFLLFLFSVLFNQYYGNKGIFPMDSTHFFDSGFRILKGDVPFVDYWLVKGPLLDYIQAFFLVFLELIGNLIYYMHLFLMD